MIKEKVKAVEVAKELNLYLKITTSVKSFDNYNPFYNIFSESEEPCRRIVVLTKDNNLEEVYDANPDNNINKYELIDGNIWIKEYTLLDNPDNIDLEDITIDINKIEYIKEVIK